MRSRLPFLSARTHTALGSGAEGGVAERGEVDRQRERVFMPQCVTNKREEKVAEGPHNKAPWLAGALRAGRRRPLRCGMTTRQRIYPPSALPPHWKFCASSTVKRTLWFQVCTEAKRENENAETRWPRDGVFNRFADRDPSAQTGTPALHWLPYVHALQTSGYSTSLIPLPSVFWHTSTCAFGFFCGTAH